MKEQTQDAIMENEEQLTQYVNFVLGDEFFAVPMTEVEEIIRQPVTFTVPLTPDYLTGLSNLRGQILPVLCLRSILEQPKAELTDATRVIVMKIAHTHVGFTVDRVLNVATPDPSTIKETNTAGGNIDAELIINTIHSDNNIIQVLNSQKLLGDSIHAEIERCSKRFGNSAMQAHDLEELDDDDSSMRQLVCCLVDGQEYAFYLEDTKEIVRIPENITRVPKAAKSILGLMNLRDKTLPLMSLRSLFGLPQIAFNESHRVLVVNFTNEGHVIPIGIVIDAVREVIRLHVSQLDPVPEIMKSMGQSTDISAICNLDEGGRTLSVVDVNNLFDSDTVGSLTDVVQQEGLEMSDMDDDLYSSEDDSTDTQLVIFKLDKEEFGISIHAVQEIIRIPSNISRVPRTDDFIEGVINLRGNVLPIVDLRKRFQLDEMERHDRQRILVVNFDRVSTGFVVDSVSEVLRIPESQLEFAPTLSEEQAKLMKQVVNYNQRMIGVLSADQLLNNTEMYKLYMAANEAEGLAN